jgi:hypothetical protein
MPLKVFEFQNKKTGEIIEHHTYEAPGPEWQRIFSFGVGQVQGAGNTPARSSKVTNGRIS